MLTANGIPATDEAVATPFRYSHLGSLAYIGNAAVFDAGNYSLMGGLMAMYAWRSVYWSEQVSSRTRALLMFDWIIRSVQLEGSNICKAFADSFFAFLQRCMGSGPLKVMIMNRSPFRFCANLTDI